MKETQTVQTSTESDVSTEALLRASARAAERASPEAALLSLAGLVLLCGRRQGH